MEPTQSEILGVLARGEWFRTLPEDLQRLLVSRARLRRLRRGEHLINEGHPPSGLAAVVAGNVHVTRRSGVGEASLLHVGGPGFWTGELALLLGCEHVVSVVAQTEALAIELSAEAIADLVRERPEFPRLLSGLAITRYAMVLRQVSDLLALDKESLLRARLADLIDTRLLDDPGAGYDVQIPQAELAALIGVSRQTLNDLLKRLEAAGSIEVSYRKITVLDVTSLRGERPRTEIFRRLGQD